MTKPNKLEFKTKKQTLFSISILYMKRFKKSRSETKEGRLLYNRELALARKKIKQYKIHLTKPLPKRL